MDIRQIAPGLSVGPQIVPADIAALKAAGFGAIVSNRPDGEEAGQPASAEIARAAQAAGLAFRAQPIRPGQVGAQDAADFGALLEALPGPVFAYCRTGTRAATLWALSQAGRRPAEGIIAAARAAGYDLAPLRDRLERGAVED
ncbi:TIGR01244 family sulfur transferase [Wenxinia saemankumensis]|uniref:Sulfide:quinone oxidoreductase n=1 Tax=Wenxinia saemankumensis TaxID=1447782 RepID=A0A1M6ES19_9RHOB|nr:TIGR01244 family sulfur transferase [Wenxinia saemankumensis]SHI88175.1 sulfide:quinone oxidoreductase [Wenxinia saemankumensis]